MELENILPGIVAEVSSTEIIDARAALERVEASYKANGAEAQLNMIAHDLSGDQF